MKRMSNIFGLQIPPASQMLGDCSLGCFFVCTLLPHCPIILVNEIRIATHAEAGYWIQDATVDAISNIEISSDGQVITLYLASNCDITFSRS